MSLVQHLRRAAASRCSESLPALGTKQQRRASHYMLTEFRPRIFVKGTLMRFTLRDVLQLLQFEPIVRRGEQWRGPCPVHGSRDPRSRSFSVNVRLGRYHCFRCGTRGHALELRHFKRSHRLRRRTFVPRQSKPGGRIRTTPLTTQPLSGMPFCRGGSVVADGWRRRKGYGPRKRTSLGAHYVATARSANCRANCPERTLSLGKDHRNRINVVQRTGVFLKSTTRRFGSRPTVFASPRPITSVSQMIKDCRLAKAGNLPSPWSVTLLEARSKMRR